MLWEVVVGGRERARERYMYSFGLDYNFEVVKGFHFFKYNLEKVNCPFI